jgi:hypothetical protein
MIRLPGASFALMVLPWFLNIASRFAGGMLRGSAVVMKEYALLRMAACTNEGTI